ncbi:hypothetical protein CMI37_30210 [Candidatus Pacearchaeota archaeon]|nr:hypothetical protein [Candidatus Pacearchaeota archaeon]
MNTAQKKSDNTQEVHICKQCACGVSNDDWTHMDYKCTCMTPMCKRQNPTGNHDETCRADEAMSGIMGMLELLGWLTHLETRDFGGYWDCAICSEIQIGTGEVYTTENEI